VASVDRRKPEHISHKGAISRRILAVHDYMCTKDLELLSFGLRLSRHAGGSQASTAKSWKSDSQG
jgi:hypothetical protein